MPRIVSLLSLILSLSLFARVSLDIEYKNFEKNKKVALNKKIEVFLDEARTLIIPKSNQILEIKLSERNFPKNLDTEVEEYLGDEVLIDVKVFELINNERSLITSPKILTIYGNPASMEMSDVDKNDKAGKKIMSLKLTPKRIK